jgi:menaquinone-9 beta-reductase
LREWWAWRDRDAWEMYWFAHDMGSQGPPPLLVREIQSRIAAEPQILEGFLRVLNHDVPPSKVFTRSLALRTLTKAMMERAGQRTTLLRDALTLTVNRLRRRGPSPPSRTPKTS